MSEDISAQDLMAAYGISFEEEAGGDYRGVMVVAEAIGGEVSQSSLGALGFGREIADTFGARLEALLMGGGEDGAQALIHRGADVALIADVGEYDQAAWAGALSSAIESRKPEVVLLGGSDISKDLAPRVAQRLDTGLIAGARHVRPEADERVVVGVVALYGGKLLGDFACPQKRPQMISLAEGAGRMPSEDRSRQGEIENLTI
jgi:electron transfer flavoprotein alpha subunit